MAFQTLSLLETFVQSERDKALANLGWLRNTHILNLKCGDPLLANVQADKALVGGGFFLLAYPEVMAQFFVARRHMSGQIGVHAACGFAYIQLEAVTFEAQDALLAQLRAKVADMNQRNSANFSVVSHSHEGSAAPFMSREVSRAVGDSSML